ncbi:caspase, EACC1-associated type [Nostoc sp. WHI]|uniref:caspase, EACC1-associated type n=1 Tax=Nostoc sp. WHI TaxID=2650611 RepID=UPI0018C7FCFD|nr:tetratricopeptide repeat protein [Nostoc sp. WHI]MBG1267357.1 tetratricopeptide repeat protein [Nostoc sp. WHI]
MQKVALLIGVSEYEPGLNPLPAAVKDIEALQRVLKDPEMGGFDDVKALPNPDRQTMESEIETLFSGRDKEDLVLLFLSGHGIKDDGNKLYFATRITRKNLKGELIRSTAVPANFVHEIMNGSRAKRQAIILDCCFSGAFDPALHAKDDGSVDLQTQLGAEGRVVLTSSSSTQYSFEQQGSDLSIYTRYLVEGIETGAGDRNEDGFVSVLELHEYAVSKVQETAPNMTPKIIVLKDKGFEIVLSKARVTDPKLRYRKAASRYANAGTIRPAGRAVLNTLRQQLGLTSGEATEIEAEILRPYQERLANLQSYREALIAEAEHEYPLSEDAREEMNRLQELLGLKDANILPIKQEVEAQFAQKSELYQQNLAQYKQVFTEAIQREFPLNQQDSQNLENLQKSLRLRDEDITGIEQPLLQQAEIRYQAKLKQEAEQQRQKQEKVEYDDKLRRYEQEFSRAIQAGYPLNQHVLEGLKAFQQQLGFKDEDVARIERLIGEPAESKYREKLRQQEEAEQQRQAELEQKRQKADYENKQKQEKVEYGDKLRRYEQEFSRAIQAGYPLNQHILEGLTTFQQQLKLKNEDVARIERLIGEPAESKYREKLRQQKEAEQQQQAELEQKRQKADYENKLHRYEQEFAKAVEAEYPLSQAILNELKNFQQQLGLKNEDVARIERIICEPLEVKYRENLRQQEEAERRQQKDLEQERQRSEYENNLQQQSHSEAQVNFDLTKSVFLTTDEMRIGVEKQITIENETITVKIPAGITIGKILGIRGKGKLNSLTQERGNLYLKCENVDSDFSDFPHIQMEFRKAIQIDTNNANAHLNLGITLHDQGKLDEAIAAFRKAIQADPKYLDAYFNLGNALEAQGKWNKAIIEYRKVIQLQPNFVKAYNLLGDALDTQGKLDEAITEYRKAIQIDPNHALTYANLGCSLSRLGKLDEALAACRKAIQIDPNHVLAHHNLGAALYAQGKLDEAIAAYRKAIQLDPNHVLAHNNLGAALQAQGKLDEAIAAYRKAIQLDPNYVLAHVILGNTLRVQGKLDEAIAAFRKAIQIDPNYVLAHVNLGFTLQAQGKLDEAIAAYRKTIQIDPNYVLAHNNLGDALQAQGKLNEAIAAFRKAIQIDPNNVDAHNNLEAALKAQG